MRTVDTLIANYLIIFVGAAAIYCFLRLSSEDKKRFLLELIIGGIILLVLAKLGAAIFNDPRPFVVGHFTPYFSHSNDNGFPSDHTLVASLLGWLVFRYSKVWGTTLLLLALSIGAARVVAGVHHWIDIVGAFIFAGISVLIAYLLGMKLLKKNTI